MKPPFAEYALSPGRTFDELYVVDFLIDRVRNAWDRDSWRRERPWNQAGYTPHINPEEAVLASAELEKLEGLGFPRDRNQKIPYRDLTALQFLPNLTFLALDDNEFRDLSPLEHCPKLTRIVLSKNQVESLAPLVHCRELRDLDLTENPITDFAALEALPVLHELKMDEDQLRKLRRVPTVRILWCFVMSFLDLPEMPNLRCWRSMSVDSLSGIERYPSLEALESLEVRGKSLEGIQSLAKLRHLEIWKSKVESLEPLAGLHALRDVEINTSFAKIDIEPLKRLPFLRKVSVKWQQRDVPGLKLLKASLISWDAEFGLKEPRFTPKLEIELVDQPTFDRYDSDEPYGLENVDRFSQMVESEAEWIDEKLEKVFSAKLSEDDGDYVIPDTWMGGRSRTVVVSSPKAWRALPKLILDMQKVLAHCRNNWIIYLESDETESEEDDFIVWVYPEKVQVTERYLARVRKLLERR